jgi:hypothetical protein
MSERQFQSELLELLERFLIIMSANDDALAALQAGQAQLTTDFATLSASVASLIAAVGAGGGGAPVNSDISAGVTAVVSDLSTLDASVTALDAQVAAAVAPAAPTDAPPDTVPAGSSDAQVPVVPEAPVSDPATA